MTSDSSGERLKKREKQASLSSIYLKQSFKGKTTDFKR